MAQGKNYLQQQYIRSTIEHIALVLSAEVWKVIVTCSVPMQCGIVKDNPEKIVARPQAKQVVFPYRL